MLDLSMPNLGRGKDKPSAEELQKYDLVGEYHSRVMANAMPQHGEDDQVALGMIDQQETLIHWQQDLREEIYHVIFQLRGMYYDEDAKEWIRIKGFKQIGNERFYAILKSYLIPLTSRNEINSNYTEQIVKERLYGVMKSLILDLGYNYEQYNLDKCDFDRVVDMVERIIHPTPFRALNNGERITTRSIYKHIEANANMPQISDGKKKKILGLF